MLDVNNLILTWHFTDGIWISGSQIAALGMPGCSEAIAGCLSSTRDHRPTPTVG